MKRVRTWLKKPESHRKLAVVAIAVGASCARWLWEDTLGRLEDLEARGMVPVDDLATLGDLDRLKGELTPQAPVDVDEPAVAPEGAVEGS